MIRLEKVNAKNFRKVLDMKLPEEQNCFVAPNVVSMAQAWLYYEEARPYAVMNDDEVVGFMMLDWDNDERTVGIWRFMIAFGEQKKGYGRAALQTAIDMVKNEKNIDSMYLDYVKGNTVARELYYSLGFRENGKMEGNEIIMTLKLTDTPKVGMLSADEGDLDDIMDLIREATERKEEVPDLFKTRESISALVKEEKVKRLTIYGDTIGLADRDVLFIPKKFAGYRDEAMQKVKGI